MPAPPDEPASSKDGTFLVDTTDLALRGYAVLPHLLGTEACVEVASLFEDDRVFRKRIVMERHGYGRGEYKYFDYPLPSIVSELRTKLYETLAPIANQAHEQLGRAARFPPSHAAFLELCHRAGQQQATPLLLKYEENDFNRMHQDLYGEVAFPLQVVVLLSRPGEDFDGGELLMSEHRARMQSRVEVVSLEQGDAALFFVAQRPVPGKRGPVRAQMRHGVSRLRRGRRLTLGIIFHDASG